MNERRPERIGRFRILETLGVGGFASVYRAYDPNLDNDVAIKVLEDVWCDDPAIRGRFTDEARIMRDRQGEHMIAVHDIIEEGRCPAIVMEYCQRGSLDQRLANREQPLTLAETLGLVDALTEATASLHRAMIVHRDIKPSNLLIRTREQPTADRAVGELLAADEELVLGDFGLAKVVHPDDTKLTLAGGTPGYGAPEQFRGSPVGPSADVYAASAVVVTAMSGLAPIPGAGQPFDEATLVSTEPLREELVKGLAPESGDRHADIGRWRTALRTAATTVETNPPPAERPASNALGWRRRSLVGLAGVLAIGATILAAVLLQGSDGDPRETEREPVASTAIGGADAGVEPSSPSDVGEVGEAVRVEFDEIASGEVTSGELIEYEIAVPADQDVFFDAWVEDGSCADRGDPQMSWRLVDVETEAIVFNDYTSASDGCFGVDKGPVPLDADRRYRLLIFYLEECGICDGRYSFMVRPVPPPDRFEIELDQVISPALPDEGAGVIETPGAVDIYELEVTAGDRFEIDNFVDSECGEGDRGLFALVPNLIDGEAPYWNALISERADCSHFDIGPFTVDRSGTLEIRYAFEEGDDATGSYSFVVRQVDGAS